MQLTDQPATELQLSALRKLGYGPERSLTRSEAAQVLLERHSAERQPNHTASELSPHEPLRLRKEVELARKRLAEAPFSDTAACEQDLEAAVQLRQQFWVDTCREMTRMQLAWPEINSLYRTYGCRFVPPTREQTQEVLNALDIAMITWERDFPQLFYQTLELNFPQLVQSR